MELINGLLFSAIGSSVSGRLLGALNQDTLINSIAGSFGWGFDCTILDALCAFDLVDGEGEAARFDFWRHH